MSNIRCTTGTIFIQTFGLSKQCRARSDCFSGAVCYRSPEQPDQYLHCFPQHYTAVAVLEINFFLAGSKYLLPSVKVGSKTNILVSKIWWPYNSPLAICTGSCQTEDKTKSHMVKGIDNAFDYMELCLVLQAVK